jgi:hypothetical protein
MYNDKKLRNKVQEAHLRQCVDKACNNVKNWKMIVTSSSTLVKNVNEEEQQKGTHHKS